MAEGNKYLLGIVFCVFMVFGDWLSSVVLCYLRCLINLQSAVHQLDGSVLESDKLLAGAMGMIVSAVPLPLGGFLGLIHVTPNRCSKKANGSGQYLFRLRVKVEHYHLHTFCLQWYI